ncbi:hypothetical protein SLE2022_083460 [Rubroshorea leprosula]
MFSLSELPFLAVSSTNGMLLAGFHEFDVFSGNCQIAHQVSRASGTGRVVDGDADALAVLGFERKKEREAIWSLGEVKKKKRTLQQ